MKAIKVDFAKRKPRKKSKNKSSENGISGIGVNILEAQNNHIAINEVDL